MNFKEITSEANSVTKGETKVDKIDYFANGEEKTIHRFDNRLEVGEKREFYSTYSERLTQTPKEGVNGSWTDERGESKYVCTKSEIMEKLQSKGVDGIEYKNALPDFSPISEASVKIDMNVDMSKNFEKADTELAKQWNFEKKNGKDDWKARDIKDYRKNHGLSWHEDADMTSCYLVPNDVHLAFGHTGGRYEYKLYNGMTWREI